jgi:tRNA1(Val) A37 N6-methylase TrmN6
MYTDDTLFEGRLVCRQHRMGYRFSVDAVLVARFCRPRPTDRVLDLGCGCGVIGLILCYLYEQLQVSGLELQPALAELASANVQLNGLQQRFQVLQGDLRRIRDFLEPESFDRVVVNPPYQKAGSGRVNPEDERAVARHEICADMESVIAASAFAVKNRGSVVLIYPAQRTGALVSFLEKYRLICKRMQPVYSYPGDDPARLILVEAVKNGGEGVCLLPPFYVYRYPDGPYSPEMAAMYQTETPTP